MRENESAAEKHRLLRKCGKTAELSQFLRRRKARCACCDHVDRKKLELSSEAFKKLLLKNPENKRISIYNSEILLLVYENLAESHPRIDVTPWLGKLYSACKRNSVSQVMFIKTVGKLLRTDGYCFCFCFCDEVPSSKCMHPSKKKSGNSADILLSIFLYNFCSILTHFSLFCHHKQSGNSMEKWTKEFLLFFFTWADTVKAQKKETFTTFYFFRISLQL